MQQRQYFNPARISANPIKHEKTKWGQSPVPTRRTQNPKGLLYVPRTADLPWATDTMGNHEPVEILQISADASMLRADRSTKIDCKGDKGLSVPTFEMASFNDLVKLFVILDGVPVWNFWISCTNYGEFTYIHLLLSFFWCILVFGMYVTECNTVRDVQVYSVHYQTTQYFTHQMWNNFQKKKSRRLFFCAISRDFRSQKSVINKILHFSIYIN